MFWLDILNHWLLAVLPKAPKNEAAAQEFKQRTLG